MDASVSGQSLQQVLRCFAYAKVSWSGPVRLWEPFYVHIRLNNKTDSRWVMHYLSTSCFPNDACVKIIDKNTTFKIILCIWMAGDILT